MIFCKQIKRSRDELVLIQEQSSAPPSDLSTIGPKVKAVGILLWRGPRYIEANYRVIARNDYTQLILIATIKTNKLET